MQAAGPVPCTLVRNPDPCRAGELAPAVNPSPVAESCRQPVLVGATKRLGSYLHQSNHVPDDPPKLSTCKKETTHRGGFPFDCLVTTSLKLITGTPGWNLMLQPVQDTADGFLEGGLNYVDLAFQWGLKYGISVSIDMHAANGSQNGYDHSAPATGLAGKS